MLTNNDFMSLAVLKLDEKTEKLVGLENLPLLSIGVEMISQINFP
jgi:hypothetical protein